MKRSKIIIMGAAGRDFHNFNVCFRNNPGYEVVAFTATQIPGIETRRYPKELSGEHYPNGIAIFPESELARLILDKAIDQVVFSYSDVSHEYVMHKASKVSALGPDFVLLGSERTMLKSTKPVISICAARTGAGKSQTTRRISEILTGQGKKVAIVRHPMPYGDLTKQIVQRFGSIADLDLHDCTIEEREEYEHHLKNGMIVYAGVDYEAILRKAEAEADVVLWDGGNNDTPFFKPDLEVVVLDPHRPTHAETFYPGETNLHRAQVLVLNKLDTAAPEDIRTLRDVVYRNNPRATIVEAASPIICNDHRRIQGKRVLVVEDGPTLTHGQMKYGAGIIAAEKYGAAAIIDPRPFAVGGIKETYEKYPAIGQLLPAMGYGKAQINDLERTINSSDAELVIIATPIDLSRIIRIDKPSVRVGYKLQEIGDPWLVDVLREKGFIK